MVAEDPKLAKLAGINVRRVYYGVFAFEGAAVAFAAGMVAPRTPILTSMGFDEVIMTFVVVVLGGIGSVTGSFLAGVALASSPPCSARWYRRPTRLPRPSSS